MNWIIESADPFAGLPIAAVVGLVAVGMIAWSSLRRAYADQLGGIRPDE